SFIAKGGIAQVECPQVDKRGQACALDVGLGQSQLAQLCETSEVRETLILNVDVGQKMQAEMQLLEILETSKGAQLVVGIEATARARIPDRPGKIKFLESGQAADPLEILGNNNGSSQVDADDANVSGRQFRQITEGLPAAIQDDTTALANRPFGDIPIGGTGATNQQRNRQDADLGRRTHPTAIVLDRPP